MKKVEFHAGAVSAGKLYGDQTRSSHSLAQWLILAFVTGLMLNVVLPTPWSRPFSRWEFSASVTSHFAPMVPPRPILLCVPELLLCHLLFAAVFLASLLPAFLTRYLIHASSRPATYRFGSPRYASPFIFWPWQRRAALPLPTFLAFYLFISCYPDWTGISSSDRFFVSLTSLFIPGLSVFFDLPLPPRHSHHHGARIVGLPGSPRLSAYLRRYLFKRKAVMQQIEVRGLQRLKTILPRRDKPA